MFHLDKLINLHGGELEISSLKAEAFREFSYFKTLGKEHVDLFTDEHLEIEFLWLNSNKFLALTGLSSNKFTIAISYAVPLCILEIFEALFSIPTYLEKFGDTSVLQNFTEAPPDYLGKFTNLNNFNSIYWRRCDDFDRRRMALVFTELGFLLVLYHEIAHILCNHFDQSNNKLYLIDGLYSESLTNDKNRLEEIEADWVGSSILLQQVWHPIFYPIFEESADQSYLKILFLVTGLTLGLLDSPERTILNSLKNEHPHPIHRLFSMTDSLSATLERVFEYEVEKVREARLLGLADVIRSAAMMGLPYGRWREGNDLVDSFESYNLEMKCFREFLTQKRGSAELKFWRSKKPIFRQKKSNNF